VQFHKRWRFEQHRPDVGPLQINRGPTQTMALPSGSPAVDAGNPNGCTDQTGHLLKTDQRGKLRPDPEDTSGCDIRGMNVRATSVQRSHARLTGQN
jgi:hypothetical protein